LENAANFRGLEHKILKNLVHMRWWEMSHRRYSEARNQSDKVIEFEKSAYVRYQLTLKMLNETMDLCLK